MSDMPTHETHPEWQRLLSIPGQANVVLSRAEIPDEPGVYAWFKDEDCVYVAKQATFVNASPHIDARHST